MKRLTLLLFTIFPLILYGQGSTGLVAHWDFNGSINDVSGHGHNGLNYGSVQTTGVTGVANTAQRFNGSGAHIDVPYDIELDLDTFTLMAYVRMHGFYSSACQGNYIVARGVEFTGNFYGFEISDGMWDGSCTAFSPNMESFQMAPSGNAGQPVTFWQNGGINPKLDTGVWYCVVVTYDGDTGKIYVDGSLVAFMPFAPQYTGPASGKLGIGYYPDGATGSYPYWFNGDIDDIRLYNRPFSPAEVSVYCDSVSLIDAPPAIIPLGTLIGDTICNGSSGYLVFNATAGTGPFTLIFNNGTLTDTLTGVTSGTPFSVGTLTSITSFTLVSIIDVSGNTNNTPGASATVIVSPSPVANAGNDTTACNAGSFQLNGSGGGNYTWVPSSGLSDPNIASPIAAVAGTTTFTLTVTNSAGCTDTDAVTINIITPATFTVIPFAYVCPDDSVQLHAAGGDSYQWIPATYLDDPSIADPFASPPTDMDYLVVIGSTLCSIQDTQTVHIVHRQNPEIVAAKSNDLDCGQSSTSLEADGGVVYAWQPTSTLTTPDSSITLAIPDTSTTYIVFGVDSFGCSNVDSITVYFVQDDRNHVWAPSAFTPNHDGRNDCWRIFLPSTITELKVMIFNRFGNEVFHSEDRNGCWDGSYNGEPQPIGTFFYYYKGKSSQCGDFEGKGDFNLIR